MSNIKPQDPVTLGLCTQTELDEAVRAGQLREERRRDREEKDKVRAREAQLAAAEAQGMPSTQPVAEEFEAEEAPEPDDGPEREEPTLRDVFVDENR
jgi:hypothetical protein